MSCAMPLYELKYGSSTACSFCRPQMAKDTYIMSILAGAESAISGRKRR